jgi:hypothetical protein
VGEHYIYVTKLHPRVSQYLGITTPDGKPLYLGVAALMVKRVWQSHLEAATSFDQRQYVVAPSPTPYPPNLTHDRHPVATVARESSIVHPEKGKGLTPYESTEKQWRGQHLFYHERQRKRALRVAECQVEIIDGLEALQLHPGTAPVISASDWGGITPNVNGFWIDETFAGAIRTRIAHGI